MVLVDNKEQRSGLSRYHALLIIVPPRIVFLVLP